MNTKQPQAPIGWYGETLNAILDRRPQNPAPRTPVGYDPRDLAKLLG